MAKKKNDVEFQELILSELNKLNKKVDNAKTELKQEIKASENKLRQEIKESETKLRQEIKESETKLRQKIKESEVKLEKKIKEGENKLEQKIVDAKNDLNARIDYYHPTTTPPPPPKKLYKLIKNIILVHVNDSWNEQKFQELIKQIYQDFHHLKKNKIGYVQFRVVISKTKFVRKYLEAIEFSKDYQYLIDNETNESKHI